MTDFSEDIYSFLCHNGKRLRGIKSIKYFFYVLQSFIPLTALYCMLIAMFIYLSSYTELKISIDSITHIFELTEESMVTIVMLLPFILLAFHCIKALLFILLFGWINYSCSCRILTVEEKGYGAVSIRKVRIAEEEYNTKIYITGKQYKKICKNNKTFILATNRITKHCFIV